VERRQLIAGVLVVVAVAGCSSGERVALPRPLPAVDSEPALTGIWTATAKPTAPTSAPKPVKVKAQAATGIALTSFQSCDALLTRMKREARRQVTAWGLSDGGYMTGAPAVAMAGTAGSTGSTSSAGAVAAAPVAAGGAAPAFSGTTNQEVGVDEADIVKTDGRVLLTLRPQPPSVQVVDLSGDKPRMRGIHRLPTNMYGAQLLLTGGRAVVVGPATSRQDDGYAPRTRVIVLSLADLDAPRMERSFEAEGAITAAREVAGRVLLVLQSRPEMVWAQPTDGSAAAQRKALLQNRRLVRRSTLDAWLPSVRSNRTGRTHRTDCASAMHANQESGTAMTSLLSLDPASDTPAAQVSVAGSGSIVYASTRSVYVTTSQWEAQEPGSNDDAKTQVHGFDITSPARPTYRASGQVSGTLIGQYAMSEHDGHLRVATTMGNTRAERPGEQPPSESAVTVLRPVGDELVKVGAVKGLGKGERIYAVRYQGELGYVVTFRETDPLYVIDLSDPERPVSRGELHVSGFSSYLHPVGDGLLLGIGQEVESNRQVGAQVSTFDVSNPREPTLRKRIVYRNGWSQAQGDPHALLWWPTTRLAVLPLQQYNGGQQFTGAVAVRVGEDGGLRQLTRITHPKPQDDSHGCCWGGILRSVVVGDALLTLSDAGVLSSSLETLEQRSWSPYR